jgi:hypothetical protein
MRNDETMGTFEYDGLIIDGSHSLDVKGITIASGQGKLQRGTVLAIGADKKAVILGTKDSTPALYSADCILTDDVDATSADVYTTAYQSGKFNKGALIVKSDYKLADTDIDTLRTKGIFVEGVME